MKHKIPIIGIITCIVYFFSVLVFLFTKSELALTIWEVLSIFGAPVILLVLLELSTLMKINRLHRELMLVFMGCTTALTGVAHVVNMVVTRRLIAEGVDVPTYFQIGYWPSIEMAIDYLAWGLFMGLAFFSVGLGIQKNKMQKVIIKNTVLACGIFCVVGFIGTCIINENFWYMAPIGYGIGPIVICIQMLRYEEI